MTVTLEARRAADRIRDRARPMDKRSNVVPCAGCGKLLYGSSTSLPAGQRKCQPCRRASPKSTSKTPPPEKSCAYCGTIFQPAPWRRDTCSMSCTKRLRFKDAPTSLRFDRSCEQCGQTYKATWKGQRTCSRACGALINSRLVAAAARPPEPVPIRTCRECGVEIGPRIQLCPNCKPRRASAGDIVVTQCIGCEAIFAYTFAPPAYRRRCIGCMVERKRRERKSHRNRHARRLNERALYVTQLTGARWEKILRYRVFKRDNWICQICNEPIDHKLKWPDLMVASIDHRVPLAAGGDHTYENVQASHFLCNSYKGTDQGPRPWQAVLTGQSLA